MKALMIAIALTALALGALVIFGDSRIPQITYRGGFFAGLALFAMFLVSGGSWEFRSQNPEVRFGYKPLVFFLALSPFLRLLATGFAGYRGFSSWARYACLAAAVLGASAITASLVNPMFQSRRI
jgi:hypothetical protein